MATAVQNSTCGILDRTGCPVPAENRDSIPIVRFIQSDEDIGALKGFKVDQLNFDKVIKLLTDPHSVFLFDRHIHVLKKVCKHYKHGFILRDLVPLFQLLNICADRVSEHDIYLSPMMDLLNIASRPFLMEKMSDQMTYLQDAVDAVSHLGYLMRVNIQELRGKICDTIEEFQAEDKAHPQLQNVVPVRISFRREVLGRSDLPETLVKSLSLLDHDLETRLRVLRVLQTLSGTTPACCRGILAADGAQRLSSALMTPDPSGSLVFRSVEILWNLLEYGGTQDELSAQLGSVAALGGIKDAFVDQLTNPRSLHDKQLRNDLMSIASLLATVSVTAPFIETGFVKTITLLATFQEVKSNNPLVKHLRLLSSEEDYELKRQIINILVLLSADPAVIPLYAEAKVLLALFTYVRSLDSEKPRLRPRLLEWSPAQLEELQLLVMSALCTLGPLMVEDYLTCQGSTRLLLLLEWCVGPAQNMMWYNDYLGTGNSFHGAGGRDNKKAQMRMCLRLIRSMVSTSNDQVLLDFADQGAINQLVSILSKIKDNRKSKELAVDIEMQADMIFILSVICENDQHRKELFGEGGVDVLIHYLSMNPKLLTSGLGHSRLLLTAVDAVWSCIVGCYMTEDYFLEREGIFLLIDLLEKCPHSTHSVTLGCLLDLIENPKVLPHMLAWRGPGDTSCPQLLCRLWRNEEKSIGVRRGSLGELVEGVQPLVGEIQACSGVVSLPTSLPSMSIVDVSDNLRSKIYNMFCKLGFVELPGLTSNDHVTLAIIEHYLDFKLGEVWLEVGAELELEGLRPITPDQEALEAIQRTIQDRTSHVIEIQNELISAEQQQQNINEQEFYAQLRENHRQKEKALKDWNDYVARTSNFAVLQAAKQRQRLSIEASRVAAKQATGEHVHSTEIAGISTTVFSGRFVAAGAQDPVSQDILQKDDATSVNSPQLTAVSQ